MGRDNLEKSLGRRDKENNVLNENYLAWLGFIARQVVMAIFSIATTLDRLAAM